MADREHAASPLAVPFPDMPPVAIAGEQFLPIGRGIEIADDDVRGGDVFGNRVQHHINVILGLDPGDGQQIVVLL